VDPDALNRVCRRAADLVIRSVAARSDITSVQLRANDIPGSRPEEVYRTTPQNQEHFTTDVARPQGEMRDPMFHCQPRPQSQDDPFRFQPGGSNAQPHYGSMIPMGQNIPGGYQLSLPEHFGTGVPEAMFGDAFAQVHRVVDWNLSDWSHSF
jgi:hypothetical protein